jgi:hypothetical protein
MEAGSKHRSFDQYTELSSFAFTYLYTEDTSQLVDLLDKVVDVHFWQLTRAHLVEQKSDGLNALTRIRSLPPVGG